MYESENHANTETAAGSDGFVRFMRQARKMWWVLLALILLTTLGGFIFAKVTDSPSYSATSSVLVSIEGSTEKKNATTVTNSDTYLLQWYANAYRYLLTSNQFLDKLVEQVNNNAATYKLDHELVKKDVQKAITIRQITDTSIVQLVATCERPEDAYAIATELDKTAPKEITRLYGNISAESFDKPIFPMTRNSSGNTLMFPLVGLLLGLILAAAITWLFMMLSRTVQSEADVYTGIPVKMLSAIPYSYRKRAERRKGDSTMLIHPASELAYVEAYKLLRVKVEQLHANKGYRRIMVTSAVADEGKSTVISNLAIVLSQKGKRVLIVDCDMRKPTLHLLFGQKNQAVNGLSSYLKGNCELEDLFNVNAKYDITMVAGGKYVENAAELLDSDRMRHFVDVVSERYDYILFDTPPAHVVSDAITLSSMMDASIIVVRQDYCSMELINQTIDNLSSHDTPVVGCVFNKTERTSGFSGTYHYYGSSYGHYGYSRKSYGYGYGYGYGGYGHHSEEDDDEDMIGGSSSHTSSSHASSSSASSSRSSSGSSSRSRIRRK